MVRGARSGQDWRSTVGKWMAGTVGCGRLGNQTEVFRVKVLGI